MRKLYLSFYLFGILLFFLSFLGNIIPTETNDGKEVRVWETGKVRHIHLALDPIVEAVNLVNAMNGPEKYGYGGKGDGYEWHLNQTVKRFFYSIPISIGWFTILISILLIRQIWMQKAKQKSPMQFLRTATERDQRKLKE